jgi:hypothetical protein
VQGCPYEVQENQDSTLNYQLTFGVGAVPEFELFRTLDDGKPENQYSMHDVYEYQYIKNTPSGNPSSFFVEKEIYDSFGMLNANPAN